MRLCFLGECFTFLSPNKSHISVAEEFPSDHNTDNQNRSSVTELQKLDELVCACVGGVVTVHEKPPWIVFAAVSS